MRTRLSRDILVYGVGEVVVKAFGLITLPVYTRIFSPEEYGTLSIVLTVAGLVMAVVALGGDSAFVRYFLAARTFHDRQVVTSTWIGFLGAWSVAATVLLLPLSGPLSELATGAGSAGGLMAIGLLITPLRLINLMCAQVLRIEFRAGAYTILNVTTLALTVSLGLIGAVVLDLGLLGVVLGMLAAEVAMLPLRIASARHLLAWQFSGSALLQLLKYGIPLVPTSLAYWVFTTSDRVLLGNLSTLEQVGLYSVAASLVSLTNIAITALGQAWSPHLFRTYEEDPSVAGLLSARMFTYILAGFGSIAVGMTVFAQDLIGLVAGEQFSASAAAVAPLAAGTIAYATTQVTAGGISLTGRTGYLALYSWLAAGINIVLNLLLIPRFGMVGSAWATAAAYVSLTAAYLVTSRRLWPFTYPWRRAATVILLTALAMTLGAILPASLGAFPWVGMLVLKVAYCLAFVAMLFVVGGLDRAELRSLGVAMPGFRR